MGAPEPPAYVRRGLWLLLLMQGGDIATNAATMANAANRATVLVCSLFVAFRTVRRSDGNVYDPRISLSRRARFH